MVVGGYTLHLYCNEKNDKHRWDYAENPVIFVGRTRSEAIKGARRAGWRVDWAKDVCVCPLCNRKKEASDASTG